MGGAFDLGLFDNLAESYEDWFATPLGAFVDRREQELIRRLLRPQTGQIILDVGAGTGHFLHDLVSGGAACIGVEPSLAMLSVARRRRPSNVALVRGCAEALPIVDASVDAVVCMTVLEFVADVQRAIEEAARVVKPGGRLVFGVLNSAGPWARARRREGGLWSRARFFSFAELLALVAPFGAVEYDYCVHLPPAAGRMPGPLFGVLDWLCRRLARDQGALIGFSIVRRGA